MTSSDATVADAQPAPPLGLMGQLVRFVVIGVLAAGVDFGTYHLLLAFGVWSAVAKGISFILGTTTTYILNRRFTFRSGGGSGTLAKFMVLYVVTFFVKDGVNALALHLLSHFGWRYNVAWLIAQGTATAINFVILRAYVFRERP